MSSSSSSFSSSSSLDGLSLSRQLQSSWSSWKIAKITNFHDDNFLRSIIESYDKFEKKHLIRIMIGLLGLEGEVLSRNEGSIKRFLKRCVEDKDEWIQITAGMVFSKLFTPVAGELNHIETIAKKTLDAN